MWVNDGLKLFSDFDIFSSYLLRIAFFASSIVALISFFIKTLDPERYSRIFVFVVLLFPPILTMYTFLTDLIFYGALRTNLLENPMLYVQLILGVILWIASIRYSNQPVEKRRMDHGIIICCIGFFALVLIITRSVEAHFSDYLLSVPIWKLIVKGLIGLIVAYFGYRIFKNPTRIRRGIWITIILMFVYGQI